MDRAVIFGASRGLGAELAKQACAAGYPVLGWGRKEKALAEQRERDPLFEYRVADFSKSFGQDEAIRYLLGSEPFSKVFLVVGGGPYGLFQERDWPSHEWALQVSFIFQARVIHALLAARRLEQLILVGSSVAESAADPQAASYCAAKHALRGLYASVRAETPDWDLRLFSPGYMDTEMLPKNAAVRSKGVYSPSVVAGELWTWSLTADYGGHRVYPPHPT
ncbi:MAG: SDR family NAD(P)-dependent oxidoreductase [Bdellovibrionales bacterium]|nr:SDR family NAD(P)-dependent oxidoreductase [Bdellovibrionales bacterium]